MHLYASFLINTPADISGSSFLASAIMNLSFLPPLGTNIIELLSYRKARSTFIAFASL